jgi:hypothetical protein
VVLTGWSPEVALALATVPFSLVLFAAGQWAWNGAGSEARTDGWLVQPDGSQPYNQIAARIIILVPGLRPVAQPDWLERVGTRPR